MRQVKEYRCVAGLAFSSLHILTYDSSLLLVTVSNIRLFLVLARHDRHRSRLQPGEYLLAVCTRSANQRAAPSQSTNEVSVFVSYDTEVARILTLIITVWTRTVLSGKLIMEQVCQCWSQYQQQLIISFKHTKSIFFQINHQLTINQLIFLFHAFLVRFRLDLIKQCGGINDIGYFLSDGLVWCVLHDIWKSQEDWVLQVVKTVVIKVVWRHEAGHSPTTGLCSRTQ